MDWKIQIVQLLSFLWYVKSGQIPRFNEVIEFPRTESRKDNVELVNAINTFGYRLLTELAAHNENQNVVISPTSVASLLSMTLLGTVGNTYDEIADALGFSRDILSNRKHHEYFGDLLKSLNSNKTSSKTLYADVIFVDDHIQLRDAYRMYLKRIYDGEALSVDFSKRYQVKESINDWVKNHTYGKIENFLEEPLPADTDVVLLSALYFSGQWAQPFMEGQTRELPFYRPQGEVLADLMLNSGTFDYLFSSEYGMQMIALPYNDSDTKLYALKPFRHENLSLPELMRNLDYVKIDTLISQMKPKMSVIRFPKMKLKNEVELKQSLQALGIKSIFTPQKANFALMIDGNAVGNSTATEEEIISRINRNEELKGIQDLVNSLPNPGVHVDVVKHDVKITINEYGTEAVAVSAAFIARTAELFYADSPFYIFIRNEKTKLVTFSAVIFDPTAS